MRRTIIYLVLAPIIFAIMFLAPFGVRYAQQYGLLGGLLNQREAPPVFDPTGIADRTPTGLSVGATAVRDAIDRVQPALLLCGHIHDCWGEEAGRGATRIVNLGPKVNWFALEGASK